MSEFVLFYVDSGVGHLVINRPEQRNALNQDVLTGLLSYLEEAKNNKEIKVVVLSGAGGKAFCAGMDLNQMISGEVDRGLIGQVINSLYELGKPSIAQLNGYVLAGGMGIALACDLVIADTTAEFGLPELNVGFWPYMIGIPLLRSLPSRFVLEMILTGRRVSVEEISKWGAINSVVNPSDLEKEVNKLASELASKPSDALRLGRESFMHLQSEDVEKKMAELKEELENALDTDDAREGITAFQEKRPPKWS